MNDGSSVADLVDLIRTKAAGRKRSANRYVGLEHIRRGGGLIGTAPASVSDGVNGVFEPGDVLFGKLRPKLRKAVQPNFGGYCSTDILILRPKPEHNPAFVKHAITADAVFRNAEANSIGTRMPRTSWPAVAEAPVRVPPLDEQRRIAEILDALDDAIASAEHLVSKREETRWGLHAELVSKLFPGVGTVRRRVRLQPSLYEDATQSVSLGEACDRLELILGRGKVISAVDIATSPGSYPIYSSSASGLGEFGRYGRYDFDEELVARQSVDTGLKPRD